MASKPEKRVASSVFITLAPPRRNLAVAEEVKPRLTPTLSPLLVAGCSPPPPTLDGEDALPDLDLLPPPPPSPDEEPPASMGAALISDLEQLHLPPPPPPPQVLPTPWFPHPQWSPRGPREGGRERGRDLNVCAFCHKTVSPRELAVEAMKRQYHAHCFTCRTCRRQLAGQTFYQKDGRPLCEPCYQDTLEKCGKCGEVVQEHIIRALDRAFHPACFTCVTCARCIGDESFALDSQDEVYCLDDFYRKFAPVCSICENPIIPRDGKDAFKIECMGRNFHENCYRCEDCRILLSVEPTDQGCYPLNNRLFCKPCHVKRSAAGCC
uniref:Filamin-binding LIM protein 1 n=1 Tax=Ursus maritimus TaxID=29073 RepID=A0A452V8M6_URSMA